MGVAAALAPAVAWFYREPRLTWIMLAVAGTFIFGGLSAQHTALLRRQMQFTRLSVIQVVSMGVGTGTAVVVGLLTRSYWALVCLPAASAATSAIGTWMISGWTPGRPRRGAGVRPMLSYGGHLTASSFMTYIAQNVDYLLLGYLWGPASVGLYRKSYELMMAPVRQLNAPIAAVMLPALSRLQGDSAGFSRSYLRTIQFLALAGMPLAAFSVVTADEIVQLLLGSEWAEAALLFRLLAPAAFLATIYSAPGYLFLALGQGNRQLRASVLDLIVTFTAVLAGLAWGAAGIAVAISTSVTVSFSLRTVYACRGTPVNLREILVALQPIVASSVGMGILVHLLRMTRESTTLAWFPLDLLLAGSLTFLLLNTSARGRELLRAVRRALRMGTPERNPHKSARSDLQLLESSQVSRPVS
jgi:PST family polysaccharide transporter